MAQPPAFARHMQQASAAVLRHLANASGANPSPATVVAYRRDHARLWAAGATPLDVASTRAHFDRLRSACRWVEAQEIARLQQQVMRLRAQRIQRDSALAWEREDRQRLLAAIADGPALALAPHTDTCAPADTEWLEHSLRCADLVICQTGCASHGAFWRVEDHCKRTGKTCVLVEQPGALRILRVHPTDPYEAEACTPPLDEKSMP